MASDQQFCLRWNNHQSTLVSVFDNLLESQTLVDCTLAADGQYLKAHKVVLSACSPYLEAILCQNLDKHPILILKDVKFSELKAMLDYMYRGEVNISQEQLSTFLKAAESLQIKGLTDSGGGGINDRDPPKRQDLRKPLNQPVPHIPQPRPVVPHPGLMERRSLPHFPPHIADMQPQSPRHAREGSTSPTARKRRRPNRPSSDDSNFVSTPNSLSENQPDTSDSCDVPVKQTTSSTPNVPNATTKAPETDSNRTTPQPQNNQQNSEQKQQVTVKKEFSETLLTPKTEFDYGNDNSMEDVTYEDDEEEEVDLSKPGTSFAANSQGFPPWQMGGDGSNDDSNNMYSQDVTAATNQNNSQGQKNSSKTSGKLALSKKSGHNKNIIGNRSPRLGLRITDEIQELHRTSVKHEEEKYSPLNSPVKGNSHRGKANGYGKRALCSGCGEYILKKVIRLHKKYYCGKQFNEKEWKIRGCRAVCGKCCQVQEPDSIEFHVKYICGKKPITVQCFYCPNLYQDYRRLLGHMNLTHRKRHCFLDLISVLPVADSMGSTNLTPKVVKNFFSNMLNTQQEAVLAENEKSYQLRDKTIHKCESCGKQLMGTHEYVNHVNTKCESEKHYSCFYCSFKSVLAYEVLDHMEHCHGKVFNTFDIIQARMTGIIPMIDEDLSDTVSLSNESLKSKTNGSPKKSIIKEERPRLEISSNSVFSNKNHSTVNDLQTSDIDVGERTKQNYKISHGENLCLKELGAIEKNDDPSLKQLKDTLGEDKRRFENTDTGTPVETCTSSIQNESDYVNMSSTDSSQIINQADSQEGQLNAVDFGKTCSTENLKRNMLPRACKSPIQVVDKKSPKHVHIKLEDPELEFSNKNLFEPYLESRIRALQTNTTNKCDVKENETGGDISSDSEVDFANKELFEPYATPRKMTRPSLIGHNLNKKKNVAPSSKKEEKLSRSTSNKKKANHKVGNKKKIAISQNGILLSRKTLITKKALLKANSIAQGIICKSKVSLSVSKKRIVIGKNVVKALSKRTAVTKIKCPKCLKDVHPGDLRIHKKYHCLNESTKKQWILYSGKAFCLKCRKFRCTDVIDFHVKFVCKKKKLPLQCLYCTKISKDIRSVVVHMFKAHGKKHYYQDFMTILSESENKSPQKTPQTESIQTQGKRSPKVFRHPVIFYAPKKVSGDGIEEISGHPEDRIEEHYGCLYCEHLDSMAYKTLDHMEEVHNKKHNLYDLLYAKIPTTQIEEERNCVEK